MTLFAVLLFVVAAGVKASDPGHCQRVIKYMLIKACGETKRENQHSSLPIMSDFEIENRYKHLVKGNMVRGLLAEDVYNFEINDNHLETIQIDDNTATDDPLLYTVARGRLRVRRSMIGLGHPRHITDLHIHDKIGSMSFIDGLIPRGEAPVPPSLKVQCCAPRICSMDHFKAFCEVD